MKAAHALLAAAIAAAMAAAFLMNFSIESKSSPVTMQKVRSLDIKFVAMNYAGMNPDNSNMPFIGSESAGVSIIAFMDLSDQSTRYFFENIYSNISYSFIQGGEAKFYPRPIVSYEEYRSKGRNYRAAAGLYCIYNLDREDFSGAFFEAVSGDEVSAGTYNISEGSFDKCLESFENESAIGYIQETETFALGGIKPKFYIGIEGQNNQVIEGIPSYARFRNTIRQYQLTIGE